MDPTYNIHEILAKQRQIKYNLGGPACSKSQHVKQNVIKVNFTICNRTSLVIKSAITSQLSINKFEQVELLYINNTNKYFSSR